MYYGGQLSDPEIGISISVEEKKVNSMKAVDVDNDFFRIQSRKVEHATHENYSAKSISSEHDDGFHFPIEDYGEHGAAFLSEFFATPRGVHKLFKCGPEI